MKHEGRSVSTSIIFQWELFLFDLGGSLRESRWSHAAARMEEVDVAHCKNVLLSSELCNPYKDPKQFRKIPTDP